MVDTKIGFDEASKAYYIIIEDEMLKHNYQHYISGEKKPMTKIDKPSWLLDATAPPPRTNDDFLGWYQPVWGPYAARWNIRKDSERYLSVYHEINEQDGEQIVWKTLGESRELTPLSHKLGFTGFDSRNRHSLTYNEARKRFELTKTTKRTSCVIRMPLARIQPTPSSEGGALPLPRMEIGIPSWH